MPLLPFIPFQADASNYGGAGPLFKGIPKCALTAAPLPATSGAVNAPARFAGLLS